MGERLNVLNGNPESGPAPIHEVHPFPALQTGVTIPGHLRKPSWLKVRLETGQGFAGIRRTLGELGMHTVCEEARCPNLHECWNSGTATFMLMGDTCTRGCRFCAVKTSRKGQDLDPREPDKLAEAVEKFGLEYVVITSVDRDDLPDQGAGHFAACVRALKARVPHVLAETLIPDFSGRKDLLAILVKEGPDVIAHNIETTERLTPTVRDPRARYRQTLSVLKNVKELDPSRFTKSSIMLGLGEEKEEVGKTMDDLREAGVDFLTLGQYLQPTRLHLPVQRFVPPEEFESYRALGLEKGFKYVASGPLVRSSYRAGEFFIRSVVQSKKQGSA